MQDLQLYEQILVLSGPWRVKAVNLRRGAEEVQVTVDCTEKVWTGPISGPSAASWVMGQPITSQATALGSPVAEPSIYRTAQHLRVAIDRCGVRPVQDWCQKREQVWRGTFADCGWASV